MNNDVHSDPGDEGNVSPRSPKNVNVRASPRPGAAVRRKSIEDAAFQVQPLPPAVTR